MRTASLAMITVAVLLTLKYWPQKVPAEDSTCLCPLQVYKTRMHHNKSRHLPACNRPFLLCIPLMQIPESTRRVALSDPHPSTSKHPVFCWSCILYPSSDNLESEDCINVTLEMQMKDEKYNLVSQLKSRDPNLCLVIQWAAIVNHIRGYMGSTQVTTVDSNMVFGKLTWATSEVMISVLQDAMSITEETDWVLMWMTLEPSQSAWAQPCQCTWESALFTPSWW